MKSLTYKYNAQYYKTKQSYMHALDLPPISFTTGWLSQFMMRIFNPQWPEGRINFIFYYLKQDKINMFTSSIIYLRYKAA